MRVIAGLLACIFPLSGLADTLDRIQLPDGFQIHEYAADVPNARSLALGSKGTVFVGNRSGDSVFAVQDLDGDNRADRVVKIISGLESPNGVAFRKDALFVAEISRILRFDDIESRLDDIPSPVVIRDDLPSEKHHGWRYIAFGPDDKLYVSIGAPCNVCNEPGYGTIVRMNPDGSDQEVVAEGVRNSVGLTWHPQTKELWFTDNGRDHLGDDVPPCELNRLSEEGRHFGFPFCHGGTVLDPEFGEGHHCSDFIRPAMTLGPHVAPLGLLFYTGSMFPAEYREKVFIAEHGSWNRSKRIGYRVSMVGMHGSREAVSYESFAHGWLVDEEVNGRPVDLLQMPDGALLISDDFAGKLYRVSYSGK